MQAYVKDGLHENFFIFYHEYDTGGPTKTAVLPPDNNCSHHDKHIINHILPEDICELAPMLSPWPRLVLSIKAQVLSSQRFILVFKRREGHVDLFFHNAHTNGSHDGLDVPSGFLAAVATVCYNHARLAFPLVEEVVNRILQLGGDTPIALGGEEDKSIIAGNAPSPDTSMFVRVVFGRLDSIGNTGFVEDREVVIFQINEVDGGPGS